MSCVLFSPPNHDMTWGDPDGEYVRIHIISTIHGKIFKLKIFSNPINFNFTLLKRNVLEGVSIVNDEGKNSTDGTEQSKKMKWRAESFLVAGVLLFFVLILDHINFKIDVK